MNTVLKGVAGPPGIAIGRAVLWEPDRLDVDPKPAADPRAELARLSAAFGDTASQIREIADRVAREAGEQEARIFKTHLLVLDDPLLAGQIRQLVEKDGLSAEQAVERTAATLARKFEAFEDPRLKERAIDIKDVAQRLLRNLTGASSGQSRPEGAAIIVASELTPSEVSLLDPRSVLAIVTEKGGGTSHAVILARALKIIALAGVAKLMEAAREGDAIIVDSGLGEVIVRPDQHALELYRLRQTEQRSAQARLAMRNELPATTRDGFRIEVVANIGGPGEADMADDAGADGVGVLRTEFLFLGRTAPPPEEEQFEAYKTALSRLAPRRVVIRTMDIGADKELPGWNLAKEHNPALGLRGIRLSLEREDLFACQLRALLRAAPFGNLAILLPMVSDAAEVRRTREIMRAISSQAVPLGVMIETPAAALTARELAEEADFFSIGTNDLTQYTLAVDRLNEQVGRLYQPFHPAVLRLVREVVEAARPRRRPVAVCGEMAADPLAAPLLVGMGVEELSMSPASIPAVKDAVRRVRRSEAAALAAAVLDSRSTAEVVEKLRKFAEDRARTDAGEDGNHPE